MRKATKEQTVNKNMILNKDANIENTKSEGEAKREDEQYGKPATSKTSKSNCR